MTNLHAAHAHETGDFPRLFHEFWTSLRRQQICFPKCSDCTKVHWYPMTRCPHCMSERIDWMPVSGRASLYSFTTVRRAFAAGFEVPYTIGLVEFPEVPGTRLISNIIEINESDISIGMSLTPVFVELDSPIPIVHFRPGR